MPSSDWYTIDTNTLNAVTPAFDIDEYTTETLYVYNDSGSHNNHVLQVEVSAYDEEDLDQAHDSPHWMAPPSFVLTGLGCKQFDENAQFIRVRVTTVEGAPSSCLVRFNGKR